MCDKGNSTVAHLRVAAHCQNLINFSPNNRTNAELGISHGSITYPSAVTYNPQHVCFPLRKRTLHSEDAPPNKTQHPKSEGVNLRGDADVRRHKQTLWLSSIALDQLASEPT